MDKETVITYDTIFKLDNFISCKCEEDTLEVKLGNTIKIYKDQNIFLIYRVCGLLEGFKSNKQLFALLYKGIAEDNFVKEFFLIVESILRGEIYEDMLNHEGLFTTYGISIQPGTFESLVLAAMCEYPVRPHNYSYYQKRVVLYTASKKSNEILNKLEKKADGK